MKVKVITYSTSVLNKVVRKYMELTAINESVYYALLEQHPNNREMDELCLVLRAGDTYFDYQDVHRKTLQQPAFIEAATDFAEHFIERIEQLMQRGEFLRQNLIEVCREQGMDTAPLMAYREQRKRRQQERQEQERQQKEEARERERQKAWQAEQERLELQKRRLNDGELIDTEDFLALCEWEGIHILPQTMGVFRKRTLQVSYKKIHYYIEKKRRKPNFRGCFEVLSRYQQVNVCKPICTPAPSGVPQP